MLITRTPFRASFCGGGSDIASFYDKNEGCVISTSINKYIYMSIHPSFNGETAVKYSKTEIVDDVNKLEHRIFKQCLRDLNVSGVEITSTADIPSGTGLGSSSSFTVGLLHALYSYKGKFVGKERLASEACDVEILKLGEPIGKQDQYAAAYGGINYYEFKKNGSVNVQPIIMGKEAYPALEKKIMMFYTGNIRSASKILAEQTKNISHGSKEDAQKQICELTKTLKLRLESNNIDDLGSILHKSWILKKSLASGISNHDINEAYDVAIKNGALGGKLLGAGGGGFLMFYVPDNKQEDVRLAISHLKEMKFGFDNNGSSIIYVGDK